MNKVMATFAVVTSAFLLAACNEDGKFASSEEQKAFKAFVEKCNKDPNTADCKAWKESTLSPGGN